MRFNRCAGICAPLPLISWHRTKHRRNSRYDCSGTTGKAENTALPRCRAGDQNRANYAANAPDYARWRRVEIHGWQHLHRRRDQTLPARTGQSGFMPKIIMFPTPGNRFKVRAYTIRRFDAAALELDIDIVLHGDSPASVWARTVQVGDQIGFIGPRHEYSGIKADQCLLAGDETALPAIAAILEELPAHVRASVILEVDDQADEIPLQTAAQVDVRWLHRGSSGRHDLLDEAVRSFPFPAGKVYVWVAGESHVMRNIRRFLLEERRIDKADMHISGYWS